VPDEERDAMVTCPFRQRREVCRLARWDEATAAQHRRQTLEQCGLLPVYHDATLDGVHEAIRSDIRMYLLNLEEHRLAGRGLIITGGTGVGKSCVLALVGMRMLELAGGFRFAYAADIYRALHRRDDAERAMAEELRQTSMLLFDEFAAPASSDFIYGDLEALLEYRRGKRLPTCVTCNVPMKQLAKQPQWARIADRLRETSYPPGRELMIPGGSRRAKS
jgi:DNA replication protein DnaC